MSGADQEPTPINLTFVRQLDEEMVKDIGLDKPKTAYEGLSLDERLEIKRQQAEAVYPLIEDLLGDGETEYVIVCGRDIFSSPVSLSPSEIKNLAEKSLTRLLVIGRPVRVNTLLPFIDNI